MRIYEMQLSPPSIELKTYTKDLADWRWMRGSKLAHHWRSQWVLLLKSWHSYRDIVTAQRERHSSVARKTEMIDGYGCTRCDRSFQDSMDVPWSVLLGMILYSECGAKLCWATEGGIANVIAMGRHIGGSSVCA